MNGVPLQPDMQDKAAFVDGLFAPGVRGQQDGLGGAISSGALVYSFVDTASRALLVSAWLAAWQAFAGDDHDHAAFARCPDQDFSLIEFLAGYLGTGDLDLCVPALTYDHDTTGGLAVYRNAGYQRQAFLDGGKWVYGSFDDSGAIVGDPTSATVARFLWLLLHGAHVVVITSDKDGASGVADLRDALDDRLTTATDPASSHYGGSALLSGLYYAPAGAPAPHLGRDHESLVSLSQPGAEPLLFSLLVGVTASSHRNTFLQLEGWPAQVVVSPPGGARHNGDYAANEATLWNFSTYGASVHSEKRSTPVFLAGAGFDLSLHAETGMPFYWGANADNAHDSWVHADLVILPS